MNDGMLRVYILTLFCFLGLVLIAAILRVESLVDFVKFAVFFFLLLLPGHYMVGI